jgi:hypothetical protein
MRRLITFSTILTVDGGGGGLGSPFFPREKKSKLKSSTVFGNNTSDIQPSFSSTIVAIRRVSLNLVKLHNP